MQSGDSDAKFKQNSRDMLQEEEKAAEGEQFKSRCSFEEKVGDFSAIRASIASRVIHAKFQWFLLFETRVLEWSLIFGWGSSAQNPYTGKPQTMRPRALRQKMVNERDERVLVDKRMPQHQMQTVDDMNNVSSTIIWSKKDSR